MLCYLCDTVNKFKSHLDQNGLYSLQTNDELCKVRGAMEILSKIESDEQMQL